MKQRFQNALLTTHHYLVEREPAFTLFKYAIFLCLGITSAIYIAADIEAARQTLEPDATFWEWLSMYAITIDVIAWVSLLLLYELQTSVLSDEWLNRGWKWLLLALSGACYIAVFYAMAGYFGKLFLILDHSLLPATEFCRWPEGWVVMQKLDEFINLDAANCTALSVASEQGMVYRLNGEEILFNREDYYGLGGAWSIAWADVIEGVLWIAVMGLIQVEILLQLRGELHPAVFAGFRHLKGLLYLAIIIVTSYYSIFGRAVDLYDSILWLLAFLFIELNLSEWQEESEAESFDSQSL